MTDSGLFYTCSLIEYLGRAHKLRRVDVVSTLGPELLRRIYEYSDVLHCETIESVACRFAEMSEMAQGDYDNVRDCRYTVPTYWDIGKVFARLVEDVGGEDPVRGIEAVYGSWIADAIGNYNSDMYYQSRDYLKACYEAGEVLV